MSIIDDFLNNSADEVDEMLGTKEMVCDGQTFSVVWDDYSTESEGGLGLEPQITAIATAQAADVTSPANLKNKRCTVGGVEFRIYAVRPGDVAVRFDLCSPHENR